MHLPRPIGRIVDLTVLAPLGLISHVVEHWPAYSKQMAQNRQAVLNRIQIAHLVGRMAVDKASRQAPTVATPVVALDSPLASPQPTPRGTARATRPKRDTADLPIAGYESLAAIHVVHRLATLRPEELERVREFEQSSRARRTILAKIKQLQDSAP